MADKPSHTWTDPATGKLYALFTYTNNFGQRKYVKRKARSKTHAKELYKSMEADFKEKGEETFEGDKLTFALLVDYYEKHYAKEAVLVNGLKVSGMKSWKDARQKLAVMKQYFGTRKIKSINTEDLHDYKDERLKTQTKRRTLDARGNKVAKDRSLASVQRELSLLRRVLGVARRRRWIPFNPFDEGGLISTTSEKPVSRVLTRKEEALLLAACEFEGKKVRRKYLAHMRPIVIHGIDTGMRSGETFKTRWNQVEFANDRIRVIASHTKDEEERFVPMTPRLRVELERLWNESNKDIDGLVFGISRAKRGWKSLCKAAGVHNATPHSMRHTFATRLIEQGVPLAEVALLMGHSDVKTTNRYVNLVDATVVRATAALHAYNEFEEEAEVVH